MKIFIVLSAIWLTGLAHAQETVSACDAEIQKARAEISKLKKSNPSVYYAEEEHPNMNVMKKIDKMIINRTFRCPTHKGYSYTSDGCCNGFTDANGRPKPCKQQSKYLQWKSLYDKISVTEETDNKVAELKEKVAELELRKKELMSSRKTSGNSTDAAPTPKQVINIKRSTVQKLLSSGVVENAKLKLVLTDD